jgi:uncharacterized membrane protein HdeD (DUF308 family)
MTPSESQRRKQDLTFLAFAIAYIVVGVVLFYLEFTGVISTAFFGIGMLILIAASLAVKFALDNAKKKK